MSAMRKSLMLLFAATTSASLVAQSAQPNWSAIDAETLKHFQAIVKMDTTDPPGGEKPVVDYLKQVLEAEGIPVQLFAKEAHRPNLVARIKGSGKQRPLLLMGHTDTVNVDPKKWTIRRSPPIAKAASSTAAAPSTTRTTSSPR
jgi:hypothetical protein